MSGHTLGFYPQTQTSSSGTVYGGRGWYSVWEGRVEGRKMGSCTVYGSRG